MTQPNSLAAMCDAGILPCENKKDVRLRAMRRAALSAKLALDGLGPRVRRAIDVLATATGLLLLLPTLLTAALAIKLTSRGPIFFGQERIGRGGRPFTMWKFRTMVVNADALKDQLAKQHREATDGVRFKMVRDPRVTAVGRVLRKFSIDELPQLYNVLRGDMTLIGPRPPVWREVALYDVRALRRLEVKPGLTCLWQVRGRSNLSFEQQVALGIEYVDRTRPSAEVKILLETVPAVLTGRGAY
jgi:lipopolysaccharide/colanic/teichoic acid biosynthesis glycosyltransferase